MYKRASHCKHCLVAHIILVTKYRKQILNSDISSSLLTIIENICNELNIDVLEIQSDGDHIHLLIDYLPKLSISKIVQDIKQLSTYRIRKQFSELSNHYWKRNIFWAKGYFMCSIGKGTNYDITQKYIQN